MRKGQLSFDAMIAIIVLLVTIQLFITLTNDIKESQEIMGVRAQQKSIALGIERVLQSAVMLSTTSIEPETVLGGGPSILYNPPNVPFLISYKVPKLEGGNWDVESCTVSMGAPKPTLVGGVESLTEYDAIVVDTTLKEKGASNPKIIRVETTVPINVLKEFFNAEKELDCKNGGDIFEIREGGVRP
ncbi:MAG: hypothetical protein V1676_01545 [Candidatus Diapherotrites archaeon]